MGYLERVPSGGSGPSIRRPPSTSTEGAEAPNDPKLHVFAVMGRTGAGKSSLIANAIDDPSRGPAVGHKLESCTESPTPYEFQYRGKKIVLIDNPGFGDTFRDEGEILAEIAGFLAETYRNGVKLSGIMYLHDMTSNRQTGDGRANLKIFKLLIGDDPLHKLILATTRWDEAAPPMAKARLNQLKTDPEYWRDMIDGGSRVVRLDDNRNSALNLIDMFLDDRDQKKVTLEIQDEMVRQDMNLNQTAAGKSLNEQLAAVIAKMEAEYAKKEEDLKQKHDKHLYEIKKEQASKLKNKMADMRRQQEILNQDHREVRRQIDMELQLLKKREKAQSDTMSTTNTSDAPGVFQAERKVTRSKDTQACKTKKAPRQHHYYYEERLLTRESKANPKASPNTKAKTDSKPNAGDSVEATQSNTATEAEKLLQKQKRHDHWAKLGTAVATTTIAGGLSAINPTAIPVAVLGGIDTIKCIAAFFRKQKESPRLMEDSLEKAMYSNDPTSGF